jgi:ribonuclease M5
MLKVRQPIVVEGRYDRIRLASVVDGVIIETGGFRIYRDKPLQNALRALSRSVGLIILTDSDAAGFRIRAHLKNILGPGAKLTHVYIPAVAGARAEKKRPSSEGLLGVEGMSQEALYEAFARANVGCDPVAARADFTRADLLRRRAHRRARQRQKARPCFRRLISRAPVRRGDARNAQHLLTREEFDQLLKRL